MHMAKRKARGIFCLEGDWWGDLNRSSTVKPILKLLGQNPNNTVRFIHRDVGTREELHYYLRKWSQRGRSTYPILYLAFHGKPNHICVGDQRNSNAWVTFDQLASSLGTGLRNRVVHFGSCETLATDKRNIRRFLESTGIEAATGFRNSVDWLESAAFEVLMLDVMLEQSFTPAGVARFERNLRAKANVLARTHGFRMVAR
jgi:hypothetical protein